MNFSRLTFFFNCLFWRKLQEDGSYQVVPGSQFTVARIAYKDNSSKYMYNGKNMQFKDIARLLRDVGIDLIHNRFLILQVLKM